MKRFGIGLLLLLCAAAFGCDRGEPAAAGNGDRARPEGVQVEMAASLRELSSHAGRSEDHLLRLARVAADRWYEESYPLLRQTFLEVWTPRMHIQLAEAFGGNRDWRMLTGLYDLIADARAEPLPAGRRCWDPDDQNWSEARQAYYRAVFEILGREFDSFADLQAWVRENWQAILDRSDRTHQSVGQAD